MSLSAEAEERARARAAAALPDAAPSDAAWSATAPRAVVLLARPASKSARGRLRRSVALAFPLLDVSSEAAGLRVRPSAAAAAVAAAAKDVGFARELRAYVLRGPQETAGPALRGAPVEEKARRGEIHRAIARLDKRLESRFLRDPEPQLRASWRRPRGGGPRSAAGAPPRATLRLCAWKRDVEGMLLVRLIAECAGCKPSQLSTHGMKDKKAVTTQFVTITDSADALLRASRRLAAFQRDKAQPKALFGSFEWVDRPLARGGHRANRFRVVLRGTAPDGVARRAADVAAVGFANYFGTQRVGRPTGDAAPGGVWCPGASAAAVGERIFRGEFRAACDCLMAGGAGVSEAAAVEAAGYEGGPRAAGVGGASAVAAAEDFARALWLVKRDAGAAMRFMPAQRRRERDLLRGLKRHGFGDEGAAADALMAMGHEARTFFPSAYQALLFNRAASLRLEAGPRAAVGDLLLVDGGPGVERLSEERLAALAAEGIGDEDLMTRVCLPLLGERSQLPGGPAGALLQDALRRMAPRGGAFGLKGAYRRLVVRPAWLKSEALAGGEGDAVALEFELPPGCFATALLREVTAFDPVV